MTASNFDLLSDALKAFSDYENTYALEDRDKVVLRIHAVLARVSKEQVLSVPIACSQSKRTHCALYDSSAGRGSKRAFSPPASSAEQVGTLVAEAPKLNLLSDAELDRLIKATFGNLLHINQLLAQREFARQVIAATQDVQKGCTQ